MDNQITIQDTRMAIADVHHTCHIISGQCTRKHKCTASPSPQFACPQRGRKRLSREAILRTELALEWPELVQIGRCKVQWLPSCVKKRNMASFYSKKTIYTTAADMRIGSRNCLLMLFLVHWISNDVTGVMDTCDRHLGVIAMRVILYI